jgi:hypothetical protein
VVGAPPALVAVVVDPVVVELLAPPAPLLVVDPVLPVGGLFPESSDEHRA